VYPLSRLLTLDTLETRWFNIDGFLALGRGPRGRNDFFVARFWQRRRITALRFLCRSKCLRIVVQGDLQTSEALQLAINALEKHLPVFFFNVIEESVCFKRSPHDFGFRSA